MSDVLIVEAKEVSVIETAELSILTEVDTSNSITILETTIDVLETVQESIVSDVVTELGVIETVTQGPMGPPGIPDADMAYSRRTDFVTDALLYKGEAEPGSLETAPVWRIHRLVLGVDGDVNETWADGDSAFNNVWSDRATLTYI